MTTTELNPGSVMTGDPRPEDSGSARAFHDALSSADLEYSAYSCNGVNIFGSPQSIKAAVRAFHDAGKVDDLQRNLRHWRDECGKLHAKIAVLETSRAARGDR